MQLKKRKFKVPPKGVIVRDTKGRFTLSDESGCQSKMKRNEARELLRQHGNDNRKYEQDYQFTYSAIGEQWFGHREFYESGKDFVKLGHNELSRDWKAAFNLTLPETHLPTAYNYMHGIELGLKAYLLFKIDGLLPIDLKEKQFGHKIHKLLLMACKLGLNTERCVVIPYDDPEEDETHFVSPLPKGNWVEKVFGKASEEEEKRYDCTIGINFERYSRKGTEYPISIYENQEYMYLASIAGTAYTLFDSIRMTEGFFDPKRRQKHEDFSSWLRELQSERRKNVLSKEEAIDEIEVLFEKSDRLPGPDEEPDWV